MRIPDECYRAKVEGCLLGVALGDAIGVPFEGLPPVDGLTREQLWTDFFPLPEDPGILGRTSDDTQLTYLTMTALIVDETFIPETFAHYLVEAFNAHRTDGWGGSLIRAAGNMAYRGLDWSEAGAPEGFDGNGAAMRIAPLALFYFDDIDQLVYHTRVCASITHRDPDAIAGAEILARSIAYLLDAGTFEPKRFWDQLLVAARESGSGAFLSTLLRAREFQQRPEDTDVFLEELAARGCAMTNPVTGRKGISGRAVLSVTASLFLFAQWLSDPSMIFHKIVSHGGDTDTIGAMAGALLGAWHGPRIWPEQLLSKLQDGEKFRKAIDLFASICKAECHPSSEQ